MEINPEHIPGHLFDWLEQNSFGTLDAAQQKEALLYFTEEEYNELHRVTMQLKEQQEPQGRKGMLLERFDAKHKREASVLSLMGAQLMWKAAAVFFLLFSGLLGYRLMNREQKNAGLIVDTDTLYITREVASPPIKIYDTVYIENETQPAPAYERKYPRREKQAPYESVSPGVNVIKLDELDNAANAPKRNSMKDDSLLRRYTFVTL